MIVLEGTKKKLSEFIAILCGNFFFCQVHRCERNNIIFGVAEDDNNTGISSDGSIFA